MITVNYLKLSPAINVSDRCISGAYLKTLSYIYDEAFCEKSQAVNYFCKKLHRRCLKGSIE